jgi:hypothetical protein
MTAWFYLQHHYKQFTIVALCATILACSGGSLEGDSNNPAPKVLVNAGLNTSVNEETLVNLTGSAEGQTASLTYTWRASPSITITHEDTSIASASFTTPSTVTSIIYEFVLEVVDSAGNRGTDTVQYTVLPVNELPNAVINVSQLEGEANNVFPAGSEVILDGSSSNDIDAADSGNPISAYQWQQTAGEAVLEGISIDGDSLAFFTPILDNDSNLSFSLTVTDHEGAISTDEVTLSVQSANNTMPSVNAGLDHEVFSGESIILNGQANTTIPDGNPLIFNWLNDSELDPIINDNSALQTFAIAPVVTSNQLVTFTLEISDAFGNKVDDSITINIRPLPLQPINDTGMIRQANDAAIFSQHLGDFPGQDGQRGSDIIFSNGALEKAGRGEQGFDFTRLDEIGDEVDDPTLGWLCVRDNVTGLIWETKSALGSGGLHSSDHSYSWFQAENNGDEEGSINGAGSVCSITNCNTSDYVDAANTQGLCNFNDWRLPTHDELLSIVHFGKTAGPMIDPEYFPNTSSGLSAPVWYWTIEPGADGVSTSAQNAWAIDFSNANDNFISKSTPARVRLVRAGR